NDLQTTPRFDMGPRSSNQYAKQPKIRATLELLKEASSSEDPVCGKRFLIKKATPAHRSSPSAPPHLPSRVLPYRFIFGWCALRCAHVSRHSLDLAETTAIQPGLQNIGGETPFCLLPKRSIMKLSIRKPP